ncbi:hypothetical protein JOF42_002541 [Microbacterium phyllosphaerae]|uniref:Transposase n=1 Tax=Microbacterium phyllosphaerae TaxID=124798 RepID=A0ABS4WSL0_9MICO|nr:hypothetical protein [Microbacterium phyllosphaerae]
MIFDSVARSWNCGSDRLERGVLVSGESLSSPVTTHEVGRPRVERALDWETLS